MTRSMGDAVGAAAAALVKQNPDVFGVYGTGDGIVPWTAAELALIPAGKTVVVIDQGAAGSPLLSATVRDVEAGAWTIAAAVNRNGWTAARPTIYLSEGLLARRLLPKFLRRKRMGARLATVAVGGWQGDMWIALYDNVPALNFPVPPGINVVAKQYTDTAQGGAVDLSVVFDPWWPELPPADPKGAEVIATAAYSDGRMIVALTGSDGKVYVTEQTAPGSGWTGIAAAGAIGGGAPVPAVASLAVVITGGTPSLICQGDPASGNGDVFTSWKLTPTTWADWAKIS